MLTTLQLDWDNFAKNNGFSNANSARVRFRQITLKAGWQWSNSAPSQPQTPRKSDAKRQGKDSKAVQPLDNISGNEAIEGDLGLVRLGTASVTPSPSKSRVMGHSRVQKSPKKIPKAPTFTKKGKAALDDEIMALLSDDETSMSDAMDESAWFEDAI